MSFGGGLLLRRPWQSQVPLEHQTSLVLLSALSALYVLSLVTGVTCLVVAAAVPLFTELLPSAPESRGPPPPAHLG